MLGFLKYNLDCYPVQEVPSVYRAYRCQHSIRDDPHRKTTSGETAVKLGLVDDVVPHSILLEAALSWQSRIAHLHALYLFASVSGGAVRSCAAVQNGRQENRTKTQGNYPATERILEVVETGLRRGPAVAMTPKLGRLVNWRYAAIAGAAQYLFCQYGREKRPGSDAPPAPLNSVGILGGGLWAAVLLMSLLVKRGFRSELRYQPAGHKSCAEVQLGSA